jgi:uncharacterized OB-fold protein
MGLVERQKSTVGLSHWRGRIPVNYVYTAGRAGERFFRETMNGRLLAARCSGCGRTYLPPRTYCERCFARIEDNFVEVPSQGQVHTFTVCHKKMDGSTIEEPVVMAMVRMDGTDGGLVHYLGEVHPQDVRIGMPVEAVFNPKKERKGSIFDIKYFRPRK